jgi:hypothetical protein
VELIPVGLGKGDGSYLLIVRIFPSVHGEELMEDRLVDSGRIKKAVDSLYTTYLPKGASPWCYLRYAPSHPLLSSQNEVADISLEIDPTKVDVNVSPTKSEVHFLNQDEMIDAIVGAIQVVLAGANTSRSFAVQVSSSSSSIHKIGGWRLTIRRCSPGPLGLRRRLLMIL